MIELLLIAVGLPSLAWAIAHWHLRGEDLRAFDQPTGERFMAAPDSAATLQGVLSQIAETALHVRQHPRQQRQAALRNSMDTMFAQRVLGVSERATADDHPQASWVVAPGHDPQCRTLFIHGGAFFAGSPRSHRTLTSRFAELTGGAVLVLDYRLMPEHPRRAGIDDCRRAYRWLLDNGPDGPAPAQRIFVAGDSAGGNLTLSLIAWVRDEALRPPDAAVAICPATDATLASPSLKTNVATDPMLGPMFGGLVKVPLWILRWGAWLQTRINPRDPLVSPVYGDLSRLPPVLVQASEQEMLYDDSRRYVNRARAAGSPVRLQTWVGMPHVWHIFNPELPEARAALDEIGKFMAETTGVAAPSRRHAAEAP